MTSLSELENLSIINKVATELKNHGHGESDAESRMVSEFIIDLCEKEPDQSKFIDILCRQAGLDIIFLKNIHNLITQMKKNLGVKKEAGLENLDDDGGIYENRADSKKIAERKKMFPALAAKDDADAAKQLLEPDDLPGSSSSKPRPSEDPDVMNMLAELESFQDQHKKEKKEEDDAIKREKKREKRKRRYDGSYKEPSKYDPDDEEPIPGKIYKGRVTNMKVFGAFVFIRGIKGKNEGLIHLTELSNKRIQDPESVVKRNDEIFVKVLSVTGKRISLSYKDADQTTGMDLDPERMWRRKELRDERNDKQAKYWMGVWRWFL